MVEFEIGGKQFRFEKLPAMQQFHVSRKIAPLMPPLMPVFAQVAKDLAKEKKGSMTDDLEKIGPLLQPFCDALAGMPDETAEYVFGTCLSIIRVNHSGNWISFWNSTAKMAMMADMNDAGLMIQLVARVIQDSLAPFIAGFLTSAGEPEKAPRSQNSQVESIFS